MTQSVMDPPPNPHLPRTGLPMVWPMDAEGYEKLTDVQCQLRMLNDAISGKRNSDGQVHLDQDGLGCFLGKLTDLIEEVLEDCDAAREGYEP